MLLHYIRLAVAELKLATTGMAHETPEQRMPTTDTHCSPPASGSLTNNYIVTIQDLLDTHCPLMMTQMSLASFATINEDIFVQFFTAVI